jgi:hypothetical protein
MEPPVSMHTYVHCANQADIDYVELRPGRRLVDIYQSPRKELVVLEVWHMIDLTIQRPHRSSPALPMTISQLSNLLIPLYLVIYTSTTYVHSEIAFYKLDTAHLGAY